MQATYSFHVEAETIEELQKKIMNKLIEMTDLSKVAEGCQLRITQFGVDPVIPLKSQAVETQMELKPEVANPPVMPTPIMVTHEPVIPTPLHIIPAILPAQEVGETESEDVPQFPVADGEKDSNGIPWDARIHASSKAKTKTGAWRIRRGAEDADVKKVEAELLTARLVTVPAIPAAPQVDPVPAHALPVVDAAQTVIATVAPLNASVTQARPVTPSPQYLPHAHTYVTFKANFPKVMASLLKEGKITQEYINDLKAHFQVKEIWNVLASEKACQELYEIFCNYNLITRVNG